MMLEYDENFIAEYDDFSDFEIPEFDIPDFQGLPMGGKKQGSRAFHFDGEDRLYKKPKELRPCHDKYIKFEYAADFVKSFKFPPNDGEFIYAIVSGSFIFGDILLPIAARSGGGHRMDICTLSMSKENIDMFYQMFSEGHIREANFILSDYFYAHERGKGGLFHYLVDSLVKPQKWPVKISIASVHTKIVMFKNKEYDIIISGSANLRSSANVEQFEMRNSPGLYEFNREWMDKIHEKFDVVKKPIRSRNLGGIIK